MPDGGAAGGPEGPGRLRETHGLASGSPLLTVEAGRRVHPLDRVCTPERARALLHGALSPEAADRVVFGR